MKIKYANVISAMCGEIWAILPNKLEAIGEFLELQAAGVKFTRAEIDAKVGGGARKLKPVSGRISVIPVDGIICQRQPAMDDISSGGLTGCDKIGAWIDSALADDGVGAIVLDCDSPGGSVYGVQELCDKIYNARGKKPIYAVANSLCASAAYYICSAADQMIVTPSGEVGSIGVVAMHCDQSAADEADGLKMTYIYAGKYKTEGNPHEPMSAEGLSFNQGRIDAYYDQFVASVARNRGDSQKAVREGYGQARVLGADEAVKAKLADRVASMDEVIAELTDRTNKAGRSSNARAELALAEMEM